MFGAPLALIVTAGLLFTSSTILRGVRVREHSELSRTEFWRSLAEGLAFVRRNRLLVTMASCVGLWQMSNQSANVVQILYATRQLGLSERGVGFSYVALGCGTVLASVNGHRVVRHLGPGPTMVMGFAISGLGWLLLAVMPARLWGIPSYVAMLFMFGTGAVFIFINFLSLRQSVTPAPMLGRMTSTVRWLILLPAIPGALIGGWLGEHLGLRSALGFAGGTTLLMAAIVWQRPIIRSIRTLPTLKAEAVTPFSSEAST